MVTDKLIFDFDSKDISLAKKDSITLIERLKKYNIPEKDIQVFFSGSKGFHVTIELDRTITPDQAKSLAVNKYGKGLATLDVKVYNEARILRYMGTKHQSSGLYKVPLTLKQLTDFNDTSLRKFAKNTDNCEEFDWDKVSPNESFYEVEQEHKVKPKTNTNAVDLSRMPTGWKPYKWSLIQGEFKGGDRHEALMILAATCRGLGYDKLTAYYMCKSALYKSIEKYGKGETTKDELFTGPIEDVYSDTWQGGQYSPQNNVWLAQYCEEHGFDTSSNDEDSTTTVTVDDAFDLHNKYATNIDKFSIFTGIDELDKKFRATTGMSFGIVGAPGSGKTAFAIQFLNHMSINSELCIFFSYDMFHVHVYNKLIQRHFKMDKEQVYERYQNNDEEFKKKVKEVISENYSNVEFCFKPGQNLEQIKRTIDRVEEKHGKKVKLCVFDYNELVQTDYSDATASSSMVAQGIREIAITKEICALMLYQPNKMSGDPAAEINSYINVKGSSAIGQAVTSMLSMSRPGFSPKDFRDDKFVTINCVKSRDSALFSLDLAWDGVTGTFRSMTVEERAELRNLRDRKAMEKEGKKEGGSQWG